DALHPEQVDEALDAGHVPLTGRDHVPGDGLFPARLDRVPGLHVEVLEDDLRELRGVLQRGDDARLAVVRVVAQRPVELAGRRPRPEPFADALVAAARCGGGGVHRRRRTSRPIRTSRPSCTSRATRTIRTYTSGPSRPIRAGSVRIPET